MRVRVPVPSSRGVIAMFSATLMCGNRPIALEHVADAPSQRDRIDVADVLAVDPHAFRVGVDAGG